jgi:hypothetical protein
MDHGAVMHRGSQSKGMIPDTPCELDVHARCHDCHEVADPSVGVIHGRECEYPDGFAVSVGGTMCGLCREAYAEADRINSTVPIMKHFRRARI